MSMHSRCLAPLVTVVALLPISAGAVTTIYATGFESPTFAAGALNGQGGWLQDIGGAAAFAVQSAVKLTGNQALAMASSGQPNFTRAFEAISYTPSTAAEKTLNLSFNFNITAAGNNTQHRVTLFSNNSALFDLIISADSRVGTFDETSSQSTFSTATVARDDAWHKMDAYYDFSTRRLNLFYDNTPILSNVQFLASNFTGSFNAVALQMLPSGAGTETMYVDNLSLVSTTAVPEPQTWAMLLAGVAGLGLWARRWQTA